MPFGFFVGICILSLVFSLFVFPFVQVLVGSLYLLRLILYVSSLLFIPLIFKQKNLNLLSRLIGLAVVLASFFQFAFYPDIRHLQVSEWDPHYYRVVGSFLDPGFTALILLFVLFYIWIKPQFRKKSLNWLALSVTYILFALTYSRSGYMAFLGSFGYLSIVRKSPKIFLLSAALIIATIFLLPRSPGGEGVKLERTSSIEARITNWKNSIRIFADHPLIGVGFNTYRYAQNSYGFLDKSSWLRSHSGAGADSSLLFVAATTGIFGLAAYLNWFRSVWIYSGKNMLFKTSLIALGFHSLFLNSAFYPYVLFWIFLVLSFQEVSSD